MLKLLALGLVSLLLYLGFVVVKSIDSVLEISIWNYHIEISIVSAVIIILLAQILFLCSIKLLALIFSIPTMLSNYVKRKRSLDINKFLVEIVANLLIGMEDRGIKLLSKILPKLTYYDDSINLIYSFVSSSNSDKEKYLLMLIDKKYFSVYAKKKLANMFFETSQYSLAENWGTSAFNEDDTDTALMILLIHIYAKLSKWHKMFFMVSKLQRTDHCLLNKEASIIAEYYYLASVDLFDDKELGQANQLLKFALELDNNHKKSIDYLLKINSDDKSGVFELLMDIFAKNPSFYIASLCFKFSDEDQLNVYNKLTSKVSFKNYSELFFEIACYFALPTDKIDEVKQLIYVP